VVEIQCLFSQVQDLLKQGIDGQAGAHLLAQPVEQGQLIDGLFQLPAAPLQLADQPGVVDGGGGLVGEDAEEIQIGLLERGGPPGLRVQHSDDLVVQAHGRGHLRSGPFHALHVPVPPGHVVDDHRLPGHQNVPGHPLPLGRLEVRNHVGTVATGHPDGQHLFLGVVEKNRAGVQGQDVLQQREYAIQQFVQVENRVHCLGRLVERSQPANRF
jgi:hypothetical protein